MLHKYLPGSIRERIQDLLFEHNMTQAQLAERIGISESTLNRFLSGQTDKLSSDNAMAIAGTFHVSTDFLLGLTDIPYRTNYDLEKLGLSTQAAKNLLTSKVNADMLSALLEMPTFITLLSQLAQLQNATLSAGIAGMNTLFQSLGNLLIRQAHQNPEDKPAAKEALQNIRTLRQPLYEADTAAIEATFKKLLQELKGETKTAIASGEKITSQVMEQFMNALANNETASLHTITPEQIVDAIVSTTSPFAPSNETTDQLRSALLPLFTKHAPDDADSEK